MTILTNMPALSMLSCMDALHNDIFNYIKPYE